MIKRQGHGIRPVQGLALILLLLASFLMVVVFTGHREATRAFTATGHAPQMQLNDDALGQPGSGLLWSAENSRYSWQLPLIFSPRCRLTQAGELPWRQQPSFVPDCWLAPSGRGT